MAGKNWLAVHLEHKMPDENTVVAWALMDSANTLLCQGQGPLGRVRVQAGPAAEKAEVVIFVPGSAVNLAEVNIPSWQSAHIRKALPYMIEDQVAGDLRQTHLAISAQRFGDSVPVGIVGHSQMIAWLEVLHAAGLSPVAMIPEHLLLPREPGSIFVHVHWSRSHVKLGVCRGIVVENENVALMLGLALKQRAMPCSRIEISACAASPDDIARADLLAAEVEQSLQLPVRRTNYTETLVELLARHARGADPVLNLCQGGYRPAGGGRESAADWSRAWLAAAAGFAVFAIVSLGSGWSLESRARETYDASVKEFRRMFPDEHRVVNLRRQAERRLAAGAVKGSDGMRALAALASAMAEPDLQGISVMSLRYDSASGALGAEVSAPAMAQLDKLVQVLGGAGASARVLSASEDAGLASARLELRSN
jgi:general secretion pathway protein L